MTAARRQVTLRPSEETLAALDVAADAAGLSRHDYILSVVETSLGDAIDWKPGPVESATGKDLEALITVHPMGEALAALALTLARALDSDAGMAAAAVSRELRATLGDLAQFAIPEGDDDDLDLGSPTLGDEADPE